MHDHIRQSNLIENIDSQKEDEQSMKAWLWLLKQKSLDHGIIGHLQRLITKNQKDLKPGEKGAYRKIQVYVGDHVPPAAEMVKPLMTNWLLDYRNLGALQAHIRFETIHPFVDGNGRTGRMLMWWAELHEGKLPTLFLDADKNDKYYPLFHEG